MDDSFKNKLRSTIAEKTSTYSEWHDSDSYLLPIKALESSSPINSQKTYETIARLLHYSSNPSSYTISPEEDNKLHRLLNE